MISFNEAKDKIEAMGYYATSELLYDAYNALALFNNSKNNPGQDIFAFCLEGPPGSGKTEFAKTYTKLCDQIFGNVELVEYQCDATTGKTELFEDINISAAIRGDAEHVNIPGKLIEAINKVNTGKRVVLFIDEYDKAREETDAFLLQFLQSGKINSTQHGDLEVMDKYKSNLQVILCKNDMREELSGPLSRRLRFITLDNMVPATFYKVAHRVLIDNRDVPVNDGLLNLVSLMYEKAYANKEKFNRLPSCSEMLIALEDADRLIKLANAPQSVVYNIIIKNMFKSKDDISTFDSIVSKSSKNDEKKLSELIKSMKEEKDEQDKPTDFNSLIAGKVLEKEVTKLVEKAEEMQKVIDSYKSKFMEMEQKRAEAIKEEISRINLEGGKLVSTSSKPEAIKLFDDETANIKRGCNIFDLSSGDWTDIGTITRKGLSYPFIIKKLIEAAPHFHLTVYENGFLISQIGDQKLIMINDVDSNNQSRFRLLANMPVIPSNYLNELLYLKILIEELYKQQAHTAEAITNDVLGLDEITMDLDALVYSDNQELPDKVQENVYHFVYGRDSKLSLDMKCDHPENAQKVSEKIMNGPSKTHKKSKVNR